MDVVRYLVLLFVISAAAAGCAREKTCVASPNMFCSEFRYIEKWIGAKEIEEIDSRDARDLLRIHDIIGQDIRNRLDLWSDNETTIFFRSQGVVEPDLMSYAVLLGFRKYRQGDVADMVAISRQVATPSPPPPPPPPPPLPPK